MEQSQPVGQATIEATFIPPSGSDAPVDVVGLCGVVLLLLLAGCGLYGSIRRPCQFDPWQGRFRE